MRYITAAIGGFLVALVIYLVLWFLAGRIVEGLGLAMEIGAHIAVVAFSLFAGYSTFRASLAGPRRP